MIDSDLFIPARKDAQKKTLNLKSPAKINLYLNVLNRRKDGFHNICSIVQRVSLFDRLQLAVTDKQGLHFKCSNSQIENKLNLAFRAADMVQSQYRIKAKGISVVLEKKIPLGSGLGGASSNAASVLSGLNYLLDLGLEKSELFSMGEKLGSDVNFFLEDCSAAVLSGKGERVTRINHRSDFRFLLIFTGENISTEDMYSEVRPQLTKYIDNAKLIEYCLKNRDIELLEKLFFNSFTRQYLEKSAIGRKIWDALLKLDYCPFFLSGSGSTVVTLIKNEKAKFNIYAALRRLGVKFLEVNSF